MDITWWNMYSSLSPVLRVVVMIVALIFFLYFLFFFPLAFPSYFCDIIAFEAVSIFLLQL